MAPIMPNGMAMVIAVKTNKHVIATNDKYPSSPVVWNNARKLKLKAPLPAVPLILNIPLIIISPIIQTIKPIVIKQEILMKKSRT